MIIKAAAILLIAAQSTVEGIVKSQVYESPPICADRAADIAFKMGVLGWQACVALKAGRLEPSDEPATVIAKVAAKACPNERANAIAKNAKCESKGFSGEVLRALDGPLMEEGALLTVVNDRAKRKAAKP